MRLLGTFWFLRVGKEGEEGFELGVKWDVVSRSFAGLRLRGSNEK